MILEIDQTCMHYGVGLLQRPVFFLMQTIYRCCFLKQKRYLSVEMRKQKRNGFLRYSNSIMVLTYLLNIPGRAMFFFNLKSAYS